MKNFIKTLLVIAVVSLCISCEKKDHYSDLNKTVNGYGDIVTKNLSLDPFNEIQLKGVSNVYITLSDQQSTVIKAQQNIIDVMTWEVVSNKLIIGIEENTSISNNEEIRFEIEIPELKKIIHEGIGDFNLKGDSLTQIYIDYTGIGDINCYSLPVNKCTVKSSGTGDCEVQVSDFLIVDLSGVGSVYYKGHPQIESSVTGIGQLINNN